MDRTLLWAAASLSGIYGALTVFAGIGQLSSGRIQRWAALGLVLFGMFVAAAAVLALLGSPSSLWLLAMGLAGIHAVTLYNGQKMSGRINPAHHLSRLLISIVLLLLTWLGLR